MPVIPHYLRQRAPNANDDRLQFIFKDSTWRDESSGHLYRSDDDTAGAAVWTDITTGGGGPPDPHKGSHISGGGDAFASTDLLEAVVKRIRTSQGPTDMLVGVVGDGQFLKRSGTNLVGDTPTAGPTDWPDITNKPTEFPPEAHNQAISTVTGLQAALDGKALASHTHPQSEITNLVTDLAAKQATSQKGQANGYASLDGAGLVPASQLPASGGGAWTTIKKTADESKNNSATVADDNTLKATLLANTQYSLRLRAHFLTNATADLKYRLVFTGTTTRVRRLVRRTATTDIAQTIDRKTAFDSSDVVLSTTGLNPWLEEDILLQVGASGGDIKLQWAQVTSNAGPTSCLEGSYLEFMVS